MTLRYLRPRVRAAGCNFLDNHFDYPPTFLFFSYPLSFMPYSIAFAAWIFTTLLLYLTAVYAILPRPAAVVAAMTAYPVAFNVLVGNNGFLSAGLIGFSLVFMESRPWLSGIFLGLMTYKPQLGVLIPFGLLASRNWRVLVAATAASIALAAAAAATFGLQGWPLFIYSLFDREASLSQTPDPPLWLISIFGSLQSMGVSVPISWGAQLTIAAIVTLAVCVFWAGRSSHYLKAAALCVGSVLVTPYAVGYDLCVLSIAVAFLVKDGLEHGFLLGERPIMLTCWFGLILLSGPVPAIICVVILFLVARRVIQSLERTPRGTEAAPSLLVHPTRRLVVATADHLGTRND